MIRCGAGFRGGGILDPLPDVAGDPAQLHAGGIRVRHPRHGGGRYPLPPGPESGREPQGRIPYTGTSACRRTCSCACRPCGRRPCIRDMPSAIISSTAATVPSPESPGITCASTSHMCLQQMFPRTKNGRVHSIRTAGGPPRTACRSCRIAPRTRRRHRLIMPGVLAIAGPRPSFMPAPRPGRMQAAGGSNIPSQGSAHSCSGVTHRDAPITLVPHPFLTGNTKDFQDRPRITRPVLGSKTPEFRKEPRRNKV